MAEEIFAETLVQTTREFCRVEDPARVQVEYLRNCTHMYGLKVREFANRIKQINDYLPMFPPYVLDKVNVQKLRDTELISILLRAKPISMSIAISKANVNVSKMTFEEVVSYLERLEVVTEAQRRLSGKVSDDSVSGQKRKNTTDVRGNQTDSPKNGNKRRKYVVCSICKKPGHDPDKCWFNKEKGNKPPNKNPNNIKPSGTSTERTYTYEEARQLFANLPSHQVNTAITRKKRKVVYDSSESSEGEVDTDVHVTNYFRKQR
jgi:hypothetical protein